MKTNTERSTEESRNLFELAKKVIPGGVNSPVDESVIPVPDHMPGVGEKLVKVSATS